MNKEEALTQLRKDWGDCRRCHLCETRKNIVFGSGNPSADILVIGEGPGETEDKLGLPFRGASGEILNRFLDAAQIDRNQDLFVTNIVLCWSYHIIKDERSGKDIRETRTPTKEEKLACRERLMKTIYIIDPMIIVALGKTAMQALTGKGTVITKARGEILVMEMQGVHTKVRYPVLPIYHPAYLDRSGDFTDDGPWHTTELDFGLLCQVVDHLREKYYRKVPPERDRRHEQQKEDEDRDHD
jgi:DNA polymerase